MTGYSTKHRTFAFKSLIAALFSLVACPTGAGAATFGSPNWEIDLTNAGYSDYLGDLTPGYSFREYLSGEWGAAVSYGAHDSGVKPTWLEPDFVYPNWATNSTFTTLVTPMSVTGTNADGLPIATSVIKNSDITISQRVEIIDTRIGTPMGISPASAGAGDFLLSNRYVMLQSYSMTNNTNDPLNMQFFQMLHGLNAQAGVYDNRAYAGPMGNYQYDVTLWGRDDTASTGQFDYIGFHAKVAPSAYEIGHYGIEGTDSHSSGKPQTGVHLSIEENQLSNTDAFAPAVRWVAGAQRWDLGTLAAGETRTMDVMLTIRTGWGVAPDVSGGASGSSGPSSGPGGVDYSFDSVSSGHLFVEYEVEDLGGIQDLIALGYIGTPTFAAPGGKYQIFEVEYDGTFSGMAHLAFTYDPSLLPAGFDEGSLHVFHWNGSQWEDLGGKVTGHTIAFDTDSLSPFAVAAVPEPQTWLMLLAGCALILIRMRAYSARRS
jgi:hypothetical protein